MIAQDGFEAFRQFLLQRKRRVTESHELIYRATTASEAGFTADDIFDRVKDRQVSRVSVYRVLNYLVEAGHLTTSVVDGRTVFQRQSAPW